MIKKDVTHLYEKLCAEFAEKPFDEVYETCMFYQKKYFSCWNLQFHIALLLVNHSNIAGDTQKCMNILNEAVSIFDRVINESMDVSLSKKAVQLKAFCLITLNRPVEAIDLLDDFVDSPMSSETPLAQAYQMIGEVDKAETLLQGSIFQNNVSIFGALIQLMTIYNGNYEKIKECYLRALKIVEVFNMKALQPSMYINLNLTYAIMLVSLGKNNEALDALQNYVDVCVSPEFFPLKLHGDDFFNKLDEYVTKTLCQTLNAPRSEKVIKQSMKDALINHPAFAPLKDEPRFKSLIEKINNI